MKKKISTKTWCGGFTLIELLVSLGLFMVVISISVGGFLQALRSQRYAAALIAVNSNASLALDQIVGDLRVGNSFAEPLGGGSGPRVNFNVRGEDNIVFELVDGCIKRSSDNRPEPLCISGENVHVEHLSFSRDINDFITITMAVKSSSSRDLADQLGPVNLQTSVGPRQ